MKHFFTALLIAVIVTLSLSGSETQAASQWVNVTIDNTKVPGDLTDYVVYIDLSDLPAAFWNLTNCTDIRMFKSDGTTELAREIVSCTDNGSTGTGELHVKYTGTLSSTVDTVMQLHYDGTSADYAVGATYGRNAVWSDYEFVAHDGGGVDSTGTHSPSANGGVTAGGATGQLGAATTFDGSDDFFIVGSQTTSAPFSLQVWANPDSSSATGLYMSKYETLETESFQFFQAGGGVRLRSYDAQDDRIGRNDADGAQTGWFMIHATLNATDAANSDITVYKNGSASDSADDGSGTYNGHLSGTSQFVVGAQLNSTDNASAPFGGELDEVRLRLTELTSNWITTEYNNQNSPSTFYTVSGEQGGGGGEEATTPQSAYFGDTAITGEGAIR